MSKPTRVRNKPRGTETDTSHRLGFMQGELSVPDDFDQMGKDEIAHKFNAATISTRGYRFNRKEAISASTSWLLTNYKGQHRNCFTIESAPRDN